MYDEGLCVFGLHIPIKAIRILIEFLTRQIRIIVHTYGIYTYVYVFSLFSILITYI